MSHSQQELNDVLDIYLRSKPVGVNMHLGETKVMLNQYTSSAPIIVDGKTIEEVESYIYLWKVITKDGDLLPEIKRRIALGWAAFGKVNNITKNPKKQVWQPKERSSMSTYYLWCRMVDETCMGYNIKPKWTPGMEVTQRKMKRIMLGITLQDRRTNTWILQQIGLIDINAAIKTSKHRLAGHVARLHDNRWTITTTEWTPQEQKGQEKEQEQDGGTTSYTTCPYLAADSSRQIQMVKVQVPHLSDTNPSWLIDWYIAYSITYITYSIGYLA